MKDPFILQLLQGTPKNSVFNYLEDPNPKPLNSKLQL